MPPWRCGCHSSRHELRKRCVGVSVACVRVRKLRDVRVASKACIRDAEPVQGARRQRCRAVLLPTSLKRRGAPGQYPARSVQALAPRIGLAIGNSAYACRALLRLPRAPDKRRAQVRPSLVHGAPRANRSPRPSRGDRRNFELRDGAKVPVIPRPPLGLRLSPLPFDLSRRTSQRNSRMHDTVLS